MALVYYLGKIVFDFESANGLAEKEHQNAYISTFQYVLLSAMEMMNDVQRIELTCKHRLSSALLKEVAYRRRRYVYAIQRARFGESLSQLAGILYFCDDDEVRIKMMSGDVELTVLAMSHPIYFMIESGKHRHIKLVY